MKMIEMYYSQFGEDKILHNLFRRKKSGVCVEVGANDGVNDSNSYFFEILGWTCVLIEPNPTLCQEIRKARNARLYECAASSKIGSATLYIAEGAERAHGVSTISSDPEVHDKIKSYGFRSKPIQVKTRTLDDILLEAALTSGIDFVTIDVEGHELEVLEGFSLERWGPKIIIVENNSHQENNKVQKHLKKNGYEIFKKTGVNDWYASCKNRDFVNIENRIRHVSLLYKAKVKNGLKRIPLLMSLVAFLKMEIFR